MRKMSSVCNTGEAAASLAEAEQQQGPYSLVHAEAGVMNPTQAFGCKHLKQLNSDVRHCTVKLESTLASYSDFWH